MALLVHEQLAMSLRLVKRLVVNATVSVSSILNNGQFYLKYYFLRRRNFSFKRFSKVSIATSLFSNFIHQNTKSTTGVNIYSILEERSKALLKMCLIEVDRDVLTRRHQDVIFDHIFSNTFLHRCFFNIDYR